MTKEIIRNFKVPKEIYTEYKKACIDMNLSMQEHINRLIRDTVKNHRKEEKNATPTNRNPHISNDSW